VAKNNVFSTEHNINIEKQLSQKTKEKLLSIKLNLANFTYYRGFMTIIKTYSGTAQ